MHNSDRSLHLNLHPEDQREVVAQGWGQRHPLTASPSLPALEMALRALPGPLRLLFRMPVPRTFTMVYAPRDPDELRVVCRIVRAAVASGRERYRKSGKKQDEADDDEREGERDGDNDKRSPEPAAAAAAQ